MFEKEAKQCAERKISNFIPQQWGVSLIRTEPTYETVEGAPHFYLNSLAKMWQEGAEFGYNNANEWHYPLTLDKDEQPISDNPVAESYPVEILMYNLKTGDKEVIKYDASWGYYRKDGCSIRRDNIAWQYISVPDKGGMKW